MALEIKGKRKEKGLFPPFLFRWFQLHFRSLFFLLKMCRSDADEEELVQGQEAEDGRALGGQQGVGTGEQQSDCSRSLLDRQPLLFDASVCLSVVSVVAALKKGKMKPDREKPISLFFFEIQRHCYEREASISLSSSSFPLFFVSPTETKKARVGCQVLRVSRRPAPSGLLPALLLAEHEYAFVEMEDEEGNCTVSASLLLCLPAPESVLKKILIYIFQKKGRS